MTIVAFASLFLMATTLLIAKAGDCDNADHARIAEAFCFAPLI
ncbi:MAG: hypothetical protein QM651_00455 [Rhodoblastus sp.]